MKWEYRQEIFQGVDVMNSWGAEGWELAGFFGKDGSFMILKRPMGGRAQAPPPVDTTRQPTSSASTSRSSSSSSSSSRSGNSAGASKGKFKEMI